MISELMAAAISNWHVVEMRAVGAGLFGVPGAPVSLLETEPTAFLAWFESLLREDEDTSKEITDLYEAAEADSVAPDQSPADARAARVASFAQSWA